jgi:hypothetical protein
MDRLRSAIRFWRSNCRAGGIFRQRVRPDIRRTLLGFSGDISGHVDFDRIARARTRSARPNCEEDARTALGGAGRARRCVRRSRADVLRRVRMEGVANLEPRGESIGGLCDLDCCLDGVLASRQARSTDTASKPQTRGLIRESVFVVGRVCASGPRPRIRRSPIERLWLKASRTLPRTGSAWKERSTSALCRFSPKPDTLPGSSVWRCHQSKAGSGHLR